MVLAVCCLSATALAMWPWALLAHEVTAEW